MSALALVGNLALDVISGRAPVPGGTVFHAARAYQLLQADVSLIARCAPADRTLLLPPLGALGHKVTWLDAGSTTAFSFEYRGDERIMRVDDVGDPWSADDARRLPADARWVQVGGLLEGDFETDTLAALAGEGRKLLLDAHALTRRRRTGPLELAAPDPAPALRHVTILKLNEEEAVALVGRADPEPLAELGVPEVLLTLGSRGSVVVTRAGTVHVAPAAAPSTADPTGAGDTYAAAYLHARSGGTEPGEAGRQSSRLAGRLLARGSC